ncbi:ATP-depentend DNA helicase-like protein [Boeremia exigua]|uniref:ATP-depentend DNA helicase-like protein n=1 Tax=Boeremia exigua TaxID=749465 RepID=UPI001E8CFD8A|nr:ATP-depentend DNA helicase-like protein [Boeremia exigua]KAH6619982.1 ATP-depentend DNA helicase-like protein [Boeremia exigua]
MEALLEGLNEAQKDAVTSPAGVLQVLAPPGSGKTKTLTARVAYHVIHERLQPWNIIVCTFTIKAAREMKERIKGFVGEKLEAKLILGTFHSVARRFLSRYGQEIGIDKNFGIADTDDSKAIIKRIVNRYQYMVEPGYARSRISGLKAKGITANDFAATKKKAADSEFSQIYSSYQEHLKAANLLDYDDLLIRCVDLLRQHPSCVSTIQAVLIDEYQDTNNIQYELMRLMAQKTQKITIVGDPDQSIYSFRAAEVKNLLRMRVDYPEAVVINLQNNYRSAGSILSAALAVIEQDDSRPEKALIATHCVGEQPTLRHLATANIEARWIVDEIKRTQTLSAGLLTYNDYSVLLRSAALSLSIERELGRAGIPYKMVGGKRFFDRAEIKIILNYLRAINNPDNNDAIVNVINTPSRKIGERTVKALLEEAEVRKVSLWNLVQDIAQSRRSPVTKLSTSAQQGITLFFRLVHTSREKLEPAQREPWNLLDLITYVFNQTAFEAYLKQTYKDNWKDRLANVDELIAQATQMAGAIVDGEMGVDDTLPEVEGIIQRPDSSADVLSKFLVNVALATEVERNDGEEVCQVTISTIHAAKGLEWPVVFIPAVYEGSLPHSRAEDHDEERRLLYVGMTRAKALLYLSCPMRSSGSEETKLSRFLDDRSLEKSFSSRGPDLAFKRNTVPDIASILGRPCPSLTQLSVAHALLEHLEDDKYPATRDEIDGAPGDFSSEYTGWKHDRQGFDPKRRRVESVETFRSTSVSGASTGASSVAAATSVSTSGFLSARDLQNLDQESRRLMFQGDDDESRKPAYKNVQRLDDAHSQGRKPKSRAAGQGAITSFFKGAGRALSDTPGPTPQAAGRSLKRSQSSLSGLTPLDGISNVRQVAPPRPFQPLSVPTRSLHNRPMASKPKKATVNTDTEDTRHALCLSSPSKPDMKELVTLSDDDTSKETAALAGAPATFINGSRPASTFHTTSMSMAQNQQAQRKTLGARRTMQGWSVKHTSMPKPRLQ